MKQFMRKYRLQIAFLLWCFVVFLSFLWVTESYIPAAIGTLLCLGLGFIHIWNDIAN